MVILSTFKVSFLLQGRVNVLQRERSNDNIIYNKYNIDIVHIYNLLLVILLMSLMILFISSVLVVFT